MESLVIVPPDVANLSLPDPFLAQYYNDLQERRFWIYEEIDQDLMISLCQHIIAWNQEDKDVEPEKRKPIVILFDSVGGSLPHYQMAKSVFELSLTPIIGVNMSLAASAAGLLFLYCHQRYALPDATFLYHYGSISLSGDAKNSIETMKRYEKEVDNFVDIIARHTNYEPDYIREKMQHDWEIDFDEAKEHGIIQGPVTDLNLFWGQ